MMPIPQGEFILPLFPLPNVVFFPKTRLPLHVFEPRYQQMVTDAIASEERFGVILLRPGWEEDYYGAPPVHGYGTMGEIEQFVALDDGRYNLLVNGVVRFRVLETVSDSPYRQARVVAEPEELDSIMKVYAQREWLVDLSRRYIEYLPGQAPVPELDTVELDALTNALVMSLNLSIEQKQELLEMKSLLDRAERVGEELKERIENLHFLAPFRSGQDPQFN